MHVLWPFMALPEGVRSAATRSQAGGNAPALACIRFMSVNYIHEINTAG